ncbi:MAG: S-methyl-5-thioribose-1-phosphate isomerase [Myxococcales bacterium]|nr:S-methyl-5-thioribose-1-phosphate isomerase [Myxococcales bacterium]MCB9530971.1 S-methyl-5-thioribose-1-phosphate isomerase [Myxococcales bacterium]MCB9532891.1 S-methyl-5-thioribose-1-phosphate isomerase [Myxococcales bacterium]
MVTSVTPIRWVGDATSGVVELLDQRRLPAEEVWIRYDTAEGVARGIREMVVRGAPAIGVTAAFGVVLAARGGASLEDGVAALAASRPTAVNLFWALERMRAVIAERGADVEALWAEAERIRTDDLAANVAMGEFGAAAMPDDARILTICNTGSLATAGYGTALGVIRSVHRQGRLRGVMACETRPYLQGARLTMWELMRDGIAAELVTDGMPGHLMSRGEVDAVIVGADRIAANGDAANKIGTYQLAVLARFHNLPFYVAAPTSTIDLETADGSGIPIEQRSADEVVRIGGVTIAPVGAKARHPAFDVTPAELVTGIVTEAGVARAPFGASLAALEKMR